MPAVPEKANPRAVLDDASQTLIVTVACESADDALTYRNRLNRLKALDLGRASARAKAKQVPIPPEIEALRTLLVRVKGLTVEIINCSHEDASTLFPKFKVERS